MASSGSVEQKQVKKTNNGGEESPLDFENIGRKKRETVVEQGWYGCGNDETGKG